MTDFVPNPSPFPGLYNFRATIPETNNSQNKWCYSSTVERLYTLKNVAFPVKLLMSRVLGGSVVLCPVYAAKENQTCIVKRCTNCKFEDPDNPYPNHLMKVKGISCSYVVKNGRQIISIPLDKIRDNLIHIELLCKTSCPRGPDGRLFVMLVSLMDKDGMEIGRDVIDVKSCNSPMRDLQVDEKKLTTDVGTPIDKQIATPRPLVERSSNGNKRLRSPKQNEDYVILKVPKEDAEKVNEYARMLRYTALAELLFKDSSE